jgi:hypothetical protein
VAAAEVGNNKGNSELLPVPHHQDTLSIEDGVRDGGVWFTSDIEPNGAVNTKQEAVDEVDKNTSGTGELRDIASFGGSPGRGWGIVGKVSGHGLVMVSVLTKRGMD